MKILALDLGTKLGWALHCSYAGLSAGTVVLASAEQLKEAKKQRLDRRLDLRVACFSAWLESRPVDRIVFEDVKFCISQAQAHLWGSMRGVVWSYAARRDIVVDCLDTGKLKKWTTGSGAADKQDMRTAAFTRWPDLVNITSGIDPSTHPMVCSSWDDNAVDAFCLLQWARLKQISLEE